MKFLYRTIVLTRLSSIAWAGQYDTLYEMRLTTWTTNLENWTNYGNTNYGTGYLVGNSVKFDDQGDSIVSPTIDNPDTMSVWLKGNRTTWNPGPIIRIIPSKPIP